VLVVGGMENHFVSLPRPEVLGIDDQAKRSLTIEKGVL